MLRSTLLEILYPIDGFILTKMKMPMSYALRLICLFNFFIAASAWSAVAVPPPPPLAAKSWVLMDAATGAVLVLVDGVDGGSSPEALDWVRSHASGITVVGGDASISPRVLSLLGA